MKARMFNTGPVTQRSMPFWCVANPLGDPFGGKILPPLEAIKTAGLLADAAKQRLIEATSFHDDDLVPWDPDNPKDDLNPSGPVARELKAIKQVLDKAGLAINTATCSLHGHPLFRRGGLTNPDAAIRKAARLKVERSLRIGKLFGARHFTYWVARDGCETPITVNWPKVYDWLADGLNHAVDYIKKNRMNNYRGATIEPKPNEPRGHMFLPTSGHALGFIHGRLRRPEFWGVNPELLQHESMTLLNAVHTVAYLVNQGKLSFLHLGSQIKGQFDNDFPPLIGPEGLKETAQMFWALERCGWKGVVEYDCHMLRSEGNPDDPVGCRAAFIRHCTMGLDIALALAARLRSFKWDGVSETLADLEATALMCALPKPSLGKQRRK